MLMDYVRRGLKAGLIGGVVYGIFVALIGNPLIGFIETMGHGSDPGHAHTTVPDHSHAASAHTHTHASVVSGAVTNVVSIGAGVALGLLFGAVVFGSVYYFFEPELPGSSDTKSYLLGMVGFITVSGAPWMLFPPQPPGVEQALPVDVRIAWYAIMMGIGATVCGLSGYAYVRLRAQHGCLVTFAGVTVPLVLIPVVAVLGPTNLSLGAAGSLPESLIRSFQAIVVFGQIGLWMTIASAHAWLTRREQRETARLEATSGDQEGSIWVD
jgi:predicted cobalt transporter CbtA